MGFENQSFKIILQYFVEAQTFCLSSNRFKQKSRPGHALNINKCGIVFFAKTTKLGAKYVVVQL